MNSSPALPFIIVEVGRLGWRLLLCCVCTEITAMKAALQHPQRVIRSSGWVGIGLPGCGWLRKAGRSFIKHLEDNLPLLLFSIVKNVPHIKRKLLNQSFKVEPVHSGALSSWQISSYNEEKSCPQCHH